MKLTKKNYEATLNEIAPNYDSEEWIIGGQDRRKYYYPDLFGRATRKFDPIAFEVGFQEWSRR